MSIIMNIYRKTYVVCSELNNKLIRGIKIGKINKIKKLPKNSWFLPNKIIGLHHSHKSKEMKHLESKC